MITEKKTNINFHVVNTTSRGPGMVFQNLLRGLELLNREDIDLTFNNYSDEICYSRNTINIVLQSTDFSRNNIEKLCKESKGCFVGPNVFVLPDEWKNKIKYINDFIVPSDWVFKEYKLRGLQNKNVHIWPVGIDTDVWAPNKSRQEKDPNSCFIYYKNRDPLQLKAIQSVLKENGYNINLIEYGNYVPADLFMACNNSSFCIDLSNTESQGIGLMQILSMDVPVFVFDQAFWQSPDGKQVRATSVPYFDERCGFISKGIKAELLTFIENYQKYSPREYMLENHTLIKSANNFLKIIGL